MTGKYITEQIRTLVVKLLKKIAKDIENKEDGCYCWVSYIGEALLPIVWISTYLRNNEVESLCTLLDNVQEDNWANIEERIGDNIDTDNK